MTCEKKDDGFLEKCSEYGAAVLSAINSYLRLKGNKRFFAKRPENKVIEEINDARFVGDLENITKVYDICDLCSLKGINIYPARRVLVFITQMLYRYPRLRGTLNYLGTEEGYNGIIKEIMAGSVSAIKTMRLDMDGLRDLVQVQAEGFLLDDLADNVLAMAVMSIGMLDGIILNSKNFCGLRYFDTYKNRKASARDKFAPENCYSIESVIAHEVGHLLDHLCALSDSDELLSIWKERDKKQIVRQLSLYAATSPEEFTAEGFSEYMCSPSPRALATTIGKLMEEKLEKIK